MAIDYNELVNTFMKPMDDRETERKKAILALAEKGMLDENMPENMRKVGGIVIKNAPSVDAENKLKLAQADYYGRKEEAVKTPQLTEIYNPEKGVTERYQVDASGKKTYLGLAKNPAPEMTDYQKESLQTRREIAAQNAQNAKDRMDQVGENKKLAYQIKLASDKSYGDYNDGLYSLDKAMDILQKADPYKDPVSNAKFTAERVIGKGLGGEFAANMKTATDLVTRIRTGAALNNQEISFYETVYTPKWYNDENTAKYKMETLRRIYAEGIRRKENPGTVPVNIRSIVAQTAKEMGVSPKEMVKKSTTVTSVKPLAIDENDPLGLK